ncbi:MAG: sigma 54-interacting transcriptional regulator [Eubacteriales bacterium]
MKNIMMFNPPFLYVNDTVAKARVAAEHHRIESIPVLYQNGTFAGLIERNLVRQDRLPDNSAVENYLNTSVKPLNADDPISVLAQIPLDSKTTVIPVLSEDASLVGVIPEPKFLKDILGEITRIVESIFLSENVSLANYGVIVISDEGRIVYFDMNAESILGLKGKAIYGIHINKVIHDSKLCEVAKKGQPHIRIKEKFHDNQIVLCKYRFPLYIGSKIVGAIGIFQDISEKEQLHENLRNLRGLNLEMVGILESMYDGIVVMDNNGKVIRINSSYELITGLSAHDILEADIKYLIDEGCLPGFVLSEVLEKKKRVHIIENIKGREFLIIATPVFDGDSKLVRVVVIIKDIDYLNELIMNLQVTQDIATRYYAGPEPLGAQEDIVASSIAMRRVVSLAKKVAQVDSNVLVTGETGVGKEIVARSVHECSNRRGGPFIKLNCGAIPEQLLESELFGYDSGAFTGAKKEGKPGLIELADGGTLFLDEVADLPMNLQVKLLRVLQEREVMRVGSTKHKKVDFRLIAATNRNLEQMVKENTFREDLFYRLNVIPVFIPPLRERKEDVVPLIMSFLSKFNKKYGMTKKVSPEVIKGLLNYDWPGNIREVENTIERLVVTSDSSLILADNLKENTRISNVEENNPKQLTEVLDETEKQLIYQAYQQCKTTREMAEALGISQSAVVKKMKKYGIVRP